MSNKQDTSVRVYSSVGCPVTYSTDANSTNAVFNQCIAGYGSKTIASIATDASGVATVTTDGDHSFFVNEVVQIAGVNTALNGVWKINTIESPTSFKFLTDSISVPAINVGTVMVAPLSWLDVTNVVNTKYCIKATGELFDLSDSGSSVGFSSHSSAMSASVNKSGVSSYWWLIANDKTLYFVSSYGAVAIGNIVSYLNISRINDYVLFGGTNFNLVNSNILYSISGSSQGVIGATSFKQLSTYASTFLTANAGINPANSQYVYARYFIAGDNTSLRGHLPGRFFKIGPSNSGIFPNANNNMLHIGSFGCFDITGPWD